MSEIIQTILAKRAVSVSAFKTNPVAVVKEAENTPLAILSHNKLAFYCMSHEVYKELQELVEVNETLVEQINNLKHDKLIMERMSSPGVSVSIDDL